MKIILNISILLILLQLPNNLKSQVDYQGCQECPQGHAWNTPVDSSLFDYDTIASYQLGHIESDYDLRRINPIYTIWHKGLDLRDHGSGSDQQRGDAIISPEAGTITRLIGRNYKNITIDGANLDYGYGHLFSHHNVNNTLAWRSGNFVLKMTEPDSQGDRFACIINLNTCIAYCIDNDKKVVIPNNPHCSDTLTTTNQVTDGAAFAPIGGSVNGGDLPVHLHLYKFRNPKQWYYCSKLYGSLCRYSTTSNRF